MIFYILTDDVTFLFALSQVFVDSLSHGDIEGAARGVPPHLIPNPLPMPRRPIRHDLHYNLRAQTSQRINA